MRLRGTLSWIYSKKTFKQRIQPALDDAVYEWEQAHIEGRPWKARYVAWRGRFSVIATVAAQLPISALKVIVDIIKKPA